MTGWAVPVALTAAGCFAVSTSLQHRSASGALPGAKVRLLVAYLCRRPAWLAGLAVGAAGFALHGLALRLGALIVVQPLLVSAVVLALPVRAALDRRLPARSEMLWAVVTATGLTIFLLATTPATGHARPDGTEAAICIAVGAGVAGTATWAGALVRGCRARGLLYGIASGVLFGLTAGTLKMTARVVAAPGGVVGAWSTYALVGLGAWGIAVNQYAYRSAPLAVSMPVLNIVNPVVAIGFGAVAFGELPGARPLVVALEMIGLAVMTSGVAMLARSVHASPAAPARSARPRVLGSAS